MNFILRYATVFLLLLTTMGSINAASPSGSLPIIHINTENNIPITSKEDYLNADCWIDPLETGYDAVGSEAEPLALEIRGRGNYTWIGFDKKPYKLKFGSKTKVLGMKKSKHFALLAHADDELGFLRNTAGFELSRRLGLPWTPSQRPVELILNGEYQGIYFLTENVRVDSDRVDIVEQKDKETDPQAITGGWLVEIDNYDSDPHVTVRDDGHRWGNDLWFTYKTPEVLSSEQERYLQSQMQRINDLIVASDKSEAKWTEYVDLDQLARYYIVQEILDDAESFHGSCYLYKDLGEGEKWKFGPVWDFGNSFRRTPDEWFIYQNPPYGQAWLSEMAKFPAFQDKVREVWKQFAASGYDGFEQYLCDFVKEIYRGAIADAGRWNAYGNRDILEDYKKMIGNIHARINWLSAQWGANVAFPATPDPTPEHEWNPVPNPDGRVIYLRGDFNNWAADTPFVDQGNDRYLITDFSFTGNFKIADDHWGSINLGSNGEKIALGEKYWLVSGTNENITPATEFSRVDILLDLNDPSVTITPSALLGGVEDTSIPDNLLIQGNVVCSDGNLIQVYDATGMLQHQGLGEVSISGSGLRIILVDGHAVKHIFR